MTEDTEPRPEVMEAPNLPLPEVPEPFQALPMPSDYFAQWWARTSEARGEGGNVYSTRIAHAAIRAFAQEWRSMLIAQQMRGVPSDIAGMVAFKALSARLGV